MPGLFTYKLVAFKKKGYIKNLDHCFLCRVGCRMPPVSFTLTRSNNSSIKK